MTVCQVECNVLKHPYFLEAWYLWDNHIKGTLIDDNGVSFVLFVV